MKRAADGFYVLAECPDNTALKQALPDFFVRSETRVDRGPFTLLDCHDQSLRASGRLLIEQGNSLCLILEDGGILQQPGKGTGRFVQNFPSGPVRDAMVDFPRLRALMNMGRGEVTTRSIAILDELQKTQVRCNLMSLQTKFGSVTLVRVSRLRGYDKAFSAVCAALDSMKQTGRGVDVAKVLFPDQLWYQAKPDIAISKSEPSIDVAVDIIRTFLTVARQNEDGVIADIDTEFLHDYRVALRRIRSVLSLFKGVFPEDRTAEFKQTFSELMAPTGRMRDLDVYLLEKDKYFNLIPNNIHPGLEAMFAEFEKERARELLRLSRRFKSAAYNRTMADLRRQFDGSVPLEHGLNADRAAFDYACTLIWKRYRKVCKLARSISDDTPDEAVHDLRIDCKKLRYLMEFFAPLFEARDFKTILKPLKKLQDNLGLFNDYSVQQETLLSFVAAQSSAQGRVDAGLGLAVGGLIAVLDQQQKAERDRVIVSFKSFDSPKTQRLFRSLFHQTKG